MNLIARKLPSDVLLTMCSFAATILIFGTFADIRPVDLVSRAYRGLSLPVPVLVVKLGEALSVSPASWISPAVAFVFFCLLAARVSVVSGSFHAVAAAGVTPLVLWSGVAVCQAHGRAGIALSWLVTFVVGAMVFRVRPRALVAVGLAPLAPLVGVFDVAVRGGLDAGLDFPSLYPMDLAPIGADPMRTTAQVAMRPIGAGMRPEHRVTS